MHLEALMQKLQTLLLLLSFSSLWALDDSIHLVTCNWEPFYGEHLPNQGFITQIARESFDSSGLNLKATFTDWSKAIEMSKSKGAIGLLGAYYTDERNKEYVYSLPLYSSKVIFIARKELNCT